MATKKSNGSVREALSIAGDVIEVGTFTGATVALIYAGAKTAMGVPILLTGLSVTSLAILGCLVVLLIRRK